MNLYSKEQLIYFETYVKNLFELGLINCPIHLSGGNETELIEIFKQVKEQDYVFSTHRNHYHYLLKGGDPVALVNELLGRENGICGGKGRSMHVYAPEINFYTSGIVGGMVAPAVGAALALKKNHRSLLRQTWGSGRRKPYIWCFVGDGGEDTGHFIEAARFGSARELPLTFIIEDNDLAVMTTKKERWHNHHPIEGRNILRYSYKRKYPHVGSGKHVSM